jgi:hypothetical protein
VTFEKHTNIEGELWYIIHADDGESESDRAWKCSHNKGEGWRIWSIVNGEKKELEAHELRTFRLMIVGDVRAVMMECADLSNALMDGIKAREILNGVAS